MNRWPTFLVRASVVVTVIGVLPGVLHAEKNFEVPANVVFDAISSTPIPMANISSSTLLAPNLPKDSLPLWCVFTAAVFGRGTGNITIASAFNSRREVMSRSPSPIVSLPSTSFPQPCMTSRQQCLASCPCGRIWRRPQACWRDWRFGGGASRVVPRSHRTNRRRE